MEWQPEQQDLGGLGFAGICREIYRVALRAVLPHLAIILSAPLLAHIAAFPALLPFISNDDGGVRRVASWAASIAIEMACIWVLLLISSVCIAAYVFRVALLYCTDGDSDAPDARIFEVLPRAPHARLFRMFKYVLPLAMAYIVFAGLALLALLQLDEPNKAVVLPLQLLGGAACLASAAYVAGVAHISCVVALLEDAGLFGAVRKSRALLAGKLWAAAAVFIPLDICFVALQVFFYVLVVDDALGLGFWFQMAAGTAMAVALWAVVVVTLVAQPVVYLVCKNRHHEVVDKVHLHYVGEYQKLAVEGDSGVELQPVKTAPEIPAISESPAGSTSTS